MTNTIAFIQPLTPALLGMVREVLPEGFELRVAQSVEPDHLKTLLADADYAVVWDIAVDGDLMEAAPSLKLLHKWGVGVENLDLEAARRLGVSVARTTGGNAVPVAEFTVTLMLALARSLIKAHNGMQSGQWLKNEVWRESFLLSGRTIGIVGLGMIGKQVARCLSGFGCTLLYNKPTRLSAAEESELKVEYATLDELIERSDMVSLHCPLSPATRGLINRERLSRMKPTAYLLNLARGGVVAEDDLHWALTNDVIAGAAIDVFEVEPTPPDHPLLTLPNVIVTPHSAAATFDNSRKGLVRIMDNITRFARGSDVAPIDVVVPRTSQTRIPA